MKWVGISGSWRKINKQVEKDVRRVVRQAIKEGYGIVSGGALGVDYIATDEVLKLDPSAERIRVYLPTSFEDYAKHYLKRARQGVIAEEQAEKLISQLEKLLEINEDSVVENTRSKSVNKRTYYSRNTRAINNSDRLIAFHVNNSSGVWDTIKKAEKKGIPVKKFVYNLN